MKAAAMGSRKQKRGVRNDQGDSEEKSQGNSFAPGIENDQGPCHGPSCATLHP